MDPFENQCRCDGTRMHGSDHCPECGCEEFEERCEWSTPFQNLNDGERWSLLLRLSRRS